MFDSRYPKKKITLREGSQTQPLIPHLYEMSQTGKSIKLKSRVDARAAGEGVGSDCVMAEGFLLG